MFITDKIWKLLEPACEMGDNASRKELEEGLKIGMFKIFKTDNSAMITADHRGVLRIGVAGGNLKDIVKLKITINLKMLSLDSELQKKLLNLLKKLMD